MRAAPEQAATGGMADFAFEPGETELLRHAPGWVDVLIVAVILLVEFAILAATSQEFRAEPMRYDQDTLAGVIVITLFVGAVLQFAVLVMPPLVEITDRRILRRRRLGWDDPDTLPLDTVEEIQQQGWRLVIRGGGTTLEFFCPPPFAPRVRKAIDRAKAGAGARR